VAQPQAEQEGARERSEQLEPRAQRQEGVRERVRVLELGRVAQPQAEQEGARERSEQLEPRAQRREGVRERAKVPPQRQAQQPAQAGKRVTGSPSPCADIPWSRLPLGKRAAGHIRLLKPSRTQVIVDPLCPTRGRLLVTYRDEPAR